MKYQTKDIIIKTYIFMCLLASYNISDANAENTRNNTAKSNAQIEIDNNQLALSELGMDDDDLTKKADKNLKYADTGSTKSKIDRSIENDVSATESEIFGSDEVNADYETNGIETAGNSSEIMDNNNDSDFPSGESEILDVDELEKDMGGIVDAGTASELDMNSNFDDAPPPFLGDGSEIIEEELIMAQEGDDAPINQPAVINDAGEIVGTDVSETADPIDKTLEETLNAVAEGDSDKEVVVDETVAEDVIEAVSEDDTEVAEDITPPPPLPLSPATGVAESDEMDEMLDSLSIPGDEDDEEFADGDVGEGEANEYKYKSVMELPAFLKKREYSKENQHLRPVIMRDDIVKALINNSAVGNIEKIRVFLNTGIDPNIVDKNGNTPLLVATKYRKARAINFLLVRGANPNIANKKGITPLHIAIDNNDYKLVRNLILRGANIDIATASGFTPLMSAVNKGNDKIANLLIKNGAKINAQNKKGYTALHIAGYNGSPNMVKKLIANKAALDIKTFNGLNPYDVSLARNNTESFEVIKTAVNREREQQYQLALNNLRKPLIVPEDDYENLSGDDRKKWDTSLAEWVEADSNFNSLTTIEKKLWNERRKSLTKVFPDHFSSQDPERRKALASHMQKWKDLDPPVVVASADSNSSVKGRISNRFKKFYSYNNTQDQVTIERDQELAELSDEWKEKQGVDNIDDVDLSSQIKEYIGLSSDENSEDNSEEFHREGKLIESISEFEDVVRKYSDSDDKSKVELYAEGEKLLGVIEDELSEEFSKLPEEIRVGFVLKIEKWMNLTADKNTMLASNKVQSNNPMENAPDIQPDDPNIVAFDENDLVTSELSSEQIAVMNQNNGEVEYDNTNVFEGDLSEDDIEDVVIDDVAEDDNLSDEELAALVNVANTADVDDSELNNNNEVQVSINDVNSDFIDDDIGSNPDKFVDNNSALSEDDIEDIEVTDDGEKSIDLSALEDDNSLSEAELAKLMDEANAEADNMVANDENITDDFSAESVDIANLNENAVEENAEISDSDLEFADQNSEEMTDEELAALVEEGNEGATQISDQEVADNFSYEDGMPETDYTDNNLEGGLDDSLGDDQDLEIANITTDSIVNDDIDMTDEIEVSSADVNTNAEHVVSENSNDEMIMEDDIDINIDEFDDGKPVLSAEVRNLEKAANEIMASIAQSGRNPEEMKEIQNIAEEQLALIEELKKLRRKLPRKESKIAVKVATNEEDGSIEIVDVEEVDISEIYSPVGYGNDLQIIYFGNDEGNVPEMPEINKVITP